MNKNRRENSANDAQKEMLGGPDGAARCQCGRPRYPRYELCPKCYYERKGVSKPSTQRQSPAQETPKNSTVAEILQMRPPERMPLSDRDERIRFLERRYGKTFRGKEIRYMRNPQLFAISEQAGYRRR
jgi:hypothetical protein